MLLPRFARGEAGEEQAPKPLCSSLTLLACLQRFGEDPQRQEGLFYIFLCVELLFTRLAQALSVGFERC